jgi:hypothetical protein
MTITRRLTTTMSTGKTPSLLARIERERGTGSIADVCPRMAVYRDLTGTA